MKPYDAVIVFGSKPDEHTWKFPSHVYASLDKARDVVTHNLAPYVIVSGKWALKFDWRETVQPFRECDAMADYLIQTGLPAKQILREGESKDTISNLYYVKTEILLPQQLTNLLIVSADWRLPRLQFLCKHILGNAYSTEFFSVPSLESDVPPNEAHTLDLERQFLASMEDGNHAWLKDKFYTSELYTYWKNRALKENK